MTLMIELFVLFSLGSLLVVSRFASAVRRPLAAGFAVTIVLISVAILARRLSLATSLLGIVSLYQAVNLLRVVKSRSNQAYLRVSVRRTVLSLLLIQVLILLSVAVSDSWQPSAGPWWLALSEVAFLFSAILAYATARSLRTTRPEAVSEHFSDTQLPSLSVCVPARNETNSLESCLASLTASDYPKLEIIVLDDCSQGTKTSDIIRSFAHDGVRFIQGEVPPDGWLAKNWAYQQLFEAASGEYIVFCGVDTRFEPKTLRNMVTTLLARQKRMLSILPVNVLPTGWRHQLSLLIQPARYAWELSLPRRIFNRPPILSTCWIAERKLIGRTGAFAAVRTTITPETYFAKKAVARDGYGFVHSSAELAVTSDKRQADQWETAIRTRYPQLRKRIDLVLVVSALELALVVSPMGLLIAGILQSLWLQAILAASALLLMGWSFGKVTNLTYGKNLLRGFLIAPSAVILDVYIRHESLWRYEFGEINWKGRNVCLPVMRVIPRFPKL